VLIRKIKGTLTYNVPFLIMHQLSYINRYLQYLFKGKTKYYIHSPFVYELMCEVIQDERHFYAFDEIETLRNDLLKSKKTINVEDFGAGSSKMGTQRKIKDITKYASASRKKGKLLFNLVHHYQCAHILELGTSLGLSTAYLAKVSSRNTVTTIEACTNTAKEAQTNLQILGLNNVTIINDIFEHAIPGLLNKNNSFDLIYFDGNHQKEATLKYFNQLLALKKESSIFIFDDINWSDDMHQAWQKIIEHPEVTISIGLFQMGLVFFKSDQAKQHFQLYF